MLTMEMGELIIYVKVYSQLFRPVHVQQATQEGAKYWRRPSEDFTGPVGQCHDVQGWCDLCHLCGSIKSPPSPTANSRVSTDPTQCVAVDIYCHSFLIYLFGQGWGVPFKYVQCWSSWIWQMCCYPRCGDYYCNLCTC